MRAREAPEADGMPDPERLLRKSLRGFAPYKPGTTVDEVRRTYGIAHPIKLSQNENPLGTSPRALAALHDVDALSIYFEDDHRAIKTRLAARYVAGELGEPVGATVGYQVRFEEVAGPRTRLRFLTEGGAHAAHAERP